jgi:hypothetical protein
VLLVFANKQDLPNPLSGGELAEMLELHKEAHRKWCVQRAARSELPANTHAWLLLLGAQVRAAVRRDRRRRPAGRHGLDGRHAQKGTARVINPCDDGWLASCAGAVADTPVWAA